MAGLEGVDARRFGATIHAYTAADFPSATFRVECERIGISSDRIEPISPGLEDVFIQLMAGQK